jgi:pimeloyl-ACP methyl ester carboxylesterase
MVEILNDGVRIAYDVAGEGPGLVLLHGWGCDRTWWDHAGFTSMLASDFRILNIDLRGHGASDKPHEPAAYRAENVVGDVLAVADAEGIDRFALWGLSYGGWFGWFVADQVPHRVTALVSSGSWSPFPEEEDDWLSFDVGYLEVLRRRGTAGLIEIYREEDGEDYDREYPLWAEAATLRADPEALVACQDRTLIGQGISTPLESFPVPVLLTAGAREDEQNQISTVAGQIPAGRSLLIPDMGHGAACAASSLLVPEVLNFLGPLSRTAE